MGHQTKTRFTASSWRKHYFLCVCRVHVLLHCDWLKRVVALKLFPLLSSSWAGAHVTLIFFMTRRGGVLKGAGGVKPQECSHRFFAAHDSRQQPRSPLKMILIWIPWSYQIYFLCVWSHVFTCTCEWCTWLYQMRVLMISLAPKNVWMHVTLILLWAATHFIWWLHFHLINESFSVQKNAQNRENCLKLSSNFIKRSKAQFHVNRWL